MNADSIRVTLLNEIFNLISANNTDEKILDFSDIKAAWHFGEGDSISATAIRDATKLHDAFLLGGFYETDAFPGLAGEIRVTAYHENKYFEFTRELDGNWSYISEINGATEEEQDSLTLSEAQSIIKNASERIWTTSDIFPFNIGTDGCKGFKVLPFGHQATGEYRSWNSSVPYCKDRSVNISEYFTPRQESHQSFGVFKTQFSQLPLQSTNLRAKQVTDVTEISPDSPENRRSIYLKHNVYSQMISKYVWETPQDVSPVQTSFPFESAFRR